MTSPRFVILAKAGTQLSLEQLPLFWVPAFAGMTKVGRVWA